MPEKNILEMKYILQQDDFFDLKNKKIQSSKKPHQISSPIIEDSEDSENSEDEA